MARIIGRRRFVELLIGRCDIGSGGKIKDRDAWLSSLLASLFLLVEKGCWNLAYC